MSLLRFGGWANLAIAAGHLVALGWAWSVFRWVDIEEPMRDLADQNAALPYFLTLFVAAFFLIFGLYALSAAGDLRRLPLLRPVLGFVAIVYLLRGGIDAYATGPTAVGVFVGASLGSRLGHRVDRRVLRLLFVAVLLYTAFEMARRAAGL